MFELFQRLRPKSSAADLRAARDAVDVSALQAVAATAASSRAEALLSGDVKQIAAAEARLSDAKLAAERASAALTELDRRIVEAERNELELGFRKKRDAAVKARDDAVAALHQKALPALLLAHDFIIKANDASALIRAVNGDVLHNVARTSIGDEPTLENSRQMFVKDLPPDLPRWIDSVIGETLSPP